MRAWLGDLRAAGIVPQIRLLSASTAGWEAAERGWISWFRERGDLLNVDPGGNCRDAKGKLKPTRKIKRTFKSPGMSPSARLAEISRRQMNNR
jgi:hypothetical protein